MENTLKQIEEEFDKKNLEHWGIGSVGAFAVKSFLKSSIVKVLEQLVEELQEKELTYEPDLSYQDPEFRTEQRVYEKCLSDTISYLKSEIANLSTNIDKE